MSSILIPATKKDGFSAVFFLFLQGCPDGTQMNSLIMEVCGISLSGTGVK